MVTTNRKSANNGVRNISADDMDCSIVVDDEDEAIADAGEDGTEVC